MAPYHFLENIYEKEQQFDLILSQDFPPQHPKNCVQNYQMTVFVYVIQVPNTLVSFVILPLYLR